MANGLAQNRLQRTCGKSPRSRSVFDWISQFRLSLVQRVKVMLWEKYEREVSARILV
jgi:hypothetical protein